MTGTVTADLTPIDDAETTDDWSSGVTIALDDEVFKENAGSVGLVKLSQAAITTKFDYYTANGNTYLDLSTGKETHIYIWGNVANGGGLSIRESGGVRVYIEDGAGAYNEWYVAGKDTYGGGWKAFVSYTGENPDNSSGTINPSEIQYIGITYNMEAKTIANVNNAWVDILYYGEGIVVFGGSYSDRITFEDVFLGDDAGPYGIVEKNEGIYLFQGPVTFGDSGSSNDCYFEDKSQLAVFKDAPVSPDHYKFLIRGNSGTTTDFRMGGLTGGRGIQGCFVKSNDPTKRVTFDATGIDIDYLGLYGNTFDTVGVFSLPSHLPDSSGALVSNAFISADEVDANKCKIQFGQFINASSALKIEETGHKFSDSDIINCATGLRFVSSGSYDLSGVKYTGNIVDIRNDDGTGAVTIAALAGSNPSTSSGDVVINNAVGLTVTCQTLGGVAISNARVAIYSTGVVSATGSSEYDTFMNELTSVVGVASESYNYSGDRDITVRIRKSYPAASGYDGIDYFPYVTSGEISANGYSLTAVLTPDSTAT